MATQIEILRVLKILGDIYPNHPLSSSAIEIYVQLLGDIPCPLLEQAALEHIGCSAFFPSISELRNTAFDILEASNPAPTAYEAWSEVQSEIQHIGYAGQPHFSHPLTAKVVEYLGWRNLCLSENSISDRSHFIQSYQTIAERSRCESRRLQQVNQFITSLQAVNRSLLGTGQSLGEDDLCQPIQT